MIGFRFKKEHPTDGTKFSKLLDTFAQLITYTSGNVQEAADWLGDINNEQQLTQGSYCATQFVEDLTAAGYLQKDNLGGNKHSVTAKLEQYIRQQALELIFGTLKRSREGNHYIFSGGNGDEAMSELRPFFYGDALEQISMLDTFRNAQKHGGIDNFKLNECDIEVVEKNYKTQTSVVLMIDISHSMILYGEDRITPAKHVAMAMAELLKRKYPKDTLDILVFGDDAQQIELKDLLSLQAGAYHTNTVAGLELAIDLLQRRKNTNKQIFMITDGKPSCIKENGQYYRNSFGLDKKIVSRCLLLAARAQKLKIPITTFMLADDEALRNFVEEFTKVNRGKAFYTSVQGLGTYLFEDFEQGKKCKVL